MTDETLEEWAARVAPRLSAEEWKDANHLASGGRLLLCGERLVDQAKALCAHRDSVAAGLTEPLRRVLLMPDATKGVDVRDREHCRKKLRPLGLMHENRRSRTDFGDEIARVLESKVTP